jgi:hypothetical protein
MGTKYSMEELTLDFEANYILKINKGKKKRFVVYLVYCFAKLKLFPFPFKRNECVLLHICQNENLPAQSNL